jgi:hypothetical protein
MIILEESSAFLRRGKSLNQRAPGGGHPAILLEHPTYVDNQLQATPQKSASKPTHTLTVHMPAFHISYSKLATKNWFHSLTSQRFQILLTLFSKSFSPFPHGTCSLSVSNRYLALEENYLPISAPIPKYATLRKPTVRTDSQCQTGFSPSLMLRSKKTYIEFRTGLAS